MRRGAEDKSRARTCVGCGTRLRESTTVVVGGRLPVDVCPRCADTKRFAPTLEDK